MYRGMWCRSGQEVSQCVVDSRQDVAWSLASVLLTSVKSVVRRLASTPWKCGKGIFRILAAVYAQCKPMC